jgi:hypothetical protein
LHRMASKYSGYSNLITWLATAFTNRLFLTYRNVYSSHPLLTHCYLFCLLWKDENPSQASVPAQSPIQALLTPGSTLLNFTDWDQLCTTATDKFVVIIMVTVFYFPTKRCQQAPTRQWMYTQ